jgi:cytochrome c oxidase assembly protein subunit 15
MRRPVAVWLFAVTFMLWVMIVLGGATRLWGSGLSIMEWAPVAGILPPLSHAEWERLFGLYQQIPQYKLVNDGFGLAGFQHIFWLEWTHRLWGRLIGLAVLLPLLVFWRQGRIDRRLGWRLLGLFCLGGLQGTVGWFMVASGFMAGSTAVSAYRLVVHLTLGLVLFGAMLWTALSVAMRAPVRMAGWRPMRMALLAATLLLVLTIVAGGFVAGTKAGLTYNSFPLMDGSLVPAGYASLHPLWRNWFENIAAVQFDHRLLATLSLAAFSIIGLLGIAHAPNPRLRRCFGGLLGAVLTQYSLGVATLLAVVPPLLGTLHQAVAIVVLAAALAALHGLRGAR